MLSLILSRPVAAQPVGAAATPAIPTTQPAVMTPAERKEAEAEFERAATRGWQLYEQGRSAEAAVEDEKALKLALGLYGSDDLTTARMFHHLALQYSQIGQFAKAEPLLLRSLGIRESKLGKNHPDVAASLNSLAASYEAMGQHSRAEPLFLRSLDIRESQLGKDHPEVANSLNSLAGLYFSLGQYSKAEPLYLRSLEIWESKLGKDHRYVATCLSNLASLYRAMGQYSKSEPLVLRSLEIREAKLGKDHPDVAAGLINLAGLYKNMGQYSKAEPLYLRSLEIREAKLGKDHPEVATTMHNLAGLYEAMGQYSKAEPLYLRSLEIWESKLGKDHPDGAASLNNLAGLYEAMGQYSKAEPLYLRSLGIVESKLGRDHPYVAISLNNLAFLYWAMGQYSKAEPLYLRSLEIKESKLGKDHPDVANSLNNLALVYRAMGHYSKAEPLLLRSLEIRESKLGKDHPDVAGSLNNLAAQYCSAGQYFKAEPLYLRSLEIKESKLGKDHPYVATSLYNLAHLYVAMNDLGKAFDVVHRWHSIANSIRSRVGFAGRTSLAAEADYGAGPLLPCLMLRLKKPGDVLEILEQQLAIGQREMLAESQARLSAPLPEEPQTRVDLCLARLNALNARLTEQKLAGRPVGELPQELNRAEIDYDALMVELGKQYESFVAAQTAKALSSEQVRKSPALDDQTAIVGWMEHEDWAWGYVVRKDGVHWVDLSQSVGTLPKRTEVLQRVIRSGGSADDRPLTADLAKVHECWFAPLQPHLAGIKKLVVISQGWASYLPVEMLLTAEPAAGEADPAKWPWLADKYQISYTPSCTMLDILIRQRESRKDKTWPHALFALADPPFSDEQLAAMKAEEQSPAGMPLAAAGPADPAGLAELVRFDLSVAANRLPGTRREVQMIAALSGVKDPMLLVGPKATERELSAASKSGELRKSRYVHLATHGYADGDRPELSALVLAQVPKDSEFDGILQMREVFQLKLDADLVVLSACQTGLGKRLGGEGVVGLSTSFLLTGTPTVVMSLWNVSDASTALLMQRLYRNLLAGQPKAAALREAKNWLRNLTHAQLEQLGRQDAQVAMLTRGLGQPTTAPKGERTDDKPFAHPHYWAGFILTGDPG